MKYRVVLVIKDNPQEAELALEKDVNVLIDRGYKPQGGVTVAKCEPGCYGNIYMAQAMIKG